jgi:hypothetical protein
METIKCPQLHWRQTLVGIQSDRADRRQDSILNVACRVACFLLGHRGLVQSGDEAPRQLSTFFVPNAWPAS